MKHSFNCYPLAACPGRAAAAIEDEAWFEETRGRIVASREQFAGDLAALVFEVPPSLANFVFARHPDHRGAALAAKLREQGVLVRHFQKARIEEFLRITIGTEDECGGVVALLRRLI